MNQYWTLNPGHGIDSLNQKETDTQPLQSDQVRVSIKANSINARDLMVAMGQSPMPVGDEIIPLSDGAGLVEAIGDNVTRFSPGDRVVITFNPAHQSGPFEASMAADALGELRSGLLCRELAIEEKALVKLPDNVSYEQAACLPCVGVTAWNALFEAGALKPGQTVVATGTGMVSLTAMQLAKAAGARFGITSSDNEKLERALAAGADFGVNYAERPDWDVAVREATGGEGAHLMIETAGPPSIATSVKAAAQGGRVMQIGFKAMEGPAISILDLLVGGVVICPIMVGSRQMLERLVAAVSVNQIKFAIHNRFRFDQAPEAFVSFMGEESFGKTIITTE